MPETLISVPSAVALPSASMSGLPGTIADTPWRRRDAAARGRGLLNATTQDGVLRGVPLVAVHTWFDMVVDPRRYRLPIRWTPVVRRLGRLLPRPDVVLVLSGEPQALHDRKPHGLVVRIQLPMRQHSLRPAA